MEKICIITSLTKHKKSVSSKKKKDYVKRQNPIKVSTVIELRAGFWYFHKRDDIVFDFHLTTRKRGNFIRDAQEKH